MEKEFIPHDCAVALKNLKFDAPCLAKWNVMQELIPTNYMINSGGYVAAPLYQQAFRWFREKYQLHSYFLIDPDGYLYGIFSYFQTKPIYKTCEEAELNCLRELIKLAIKREID